MSSIRFDIITIFPKVVEAYFNESILKRARKKELIDVKIWDLRRFAKDKHHKVDDKAYGGGPGMVIKIESLVRAIEKALGNRVSKSDKLVIFLSASGKQFNSQIAARFVKKYKHIILIAGHYEGVDERIKKIVSDFGFQISDLSIGPYVLTGGELPAMAIVDAVSRHIPGVLGKTESLEERRHGIGVPVYTRPEAFTFESKKYRVPKVLLSGNHKKIGEWRHKHRKMVK